MMYSDKLNLTEYSRFDDDSFERETQKDYYSEDFGHSNRGHYSEKPQSRHFLSSSNYKNSLRRSENYNFNSQTRRFNEKRYPRYSNLQYGPLRSSKDCRSENRRFSPGRMHYSKSNSYTSFSGRSPSCGATDHLYRTRTYTSDDKNIYVCHTCREADKQQPQNRDRLRIQLSHFEDTVKSSFTKEDEKVLAIKSEKYHHHENEFTEKPTFTKKDKKVLAIKSEKYHHHENEFTEKAAITKKDEKPLAIKSEKYLCHKNEDIKKRKNKISVIIDLDNEIPSENQKSEIPPVIDLESEILTNVKKKIPAVIDIDNEILTNVKNKIPAVIDLDNEIHTNKKKRKISAITDLQKKIHTKKPKSKTSTVIDFEKELQKKNRRKEPKNKIFTLIDLEKQPQIKIHTKKPKNKISTLIDLKKELQTLKSSVDVEDESEKMSEKKLHSKRRNEIRKYAAKSESKHDCKKHKAEDQNTKKNLTADADIVTLETTNPYAIETNKIDDLETVKKISDKICNIGDSCLQNKKQHKQDHDTSSDILEISVDDLEFNEFIVKEGISKEIERNALQNMTAQEAGNISTSPNCDSKELTVLSELQTARMAAILSMIKKSVSPSNRT